MTGKLIVIEGLDGSGKSTQVKKLKEHFDDIHLPVRHIKLPDYNDKSSTLVKMYLAGEFGKNPEDVNAYAASSFYAVDRYASYKRHWKTDYDNGMIILADRYTTSNEVHQMVKLPVREWDYYIRWLEDFEYDKIGIPKPDFVVYLDMPVDISQKLMTNRYSGNEVKKDVHESNVEYLTKCRKAALYAAEKCGWKVIECAENSKPLTIEKIYDSIISSIEKEIF